MSTNLKMFRGRTFAFNLAVTQAGAEYDLTGATLRMTAKYSYDDADGSAVFTVSSPASGIVITNTSGGLATVTLTPAKTTSLPTNEVSLFYDIQLTNSSGVYSIADGILTVLPNVSITTP